MVEVFGRGGYAARYEEVLFQWKRGGGSGCPWYQASGVDCTAVWVREEGGGCAEVCGLGFGGVLRGCCASLASVEEWEHGEKREGPPPSWEGRRARLHSRCMTYRSSVFYLSALFPSPVYPLSARYLSSVFLQTSPSLLSYPCSS